MAKLSKDGKFLNDIAGDLSQDLQLEYEIVKDSYKRHKAVQQAFEAKVRDYLGDQRLAFSYRYGLSCSVSEPKAEKAPAKPKINLAQWLEQQR